MVDYCRDKVGNCILYFTSECIVEAFHVHASHQPSKNRSTAAKFFVGEDGDTTVEQTGDLKDAEIAAIRKYIKKKTMLKCTKHGKDLLPPAIIIT